MMLKSKTNTQHAHIRVSGELVHPGQKKDRKKSHTDDLFKNHTLNSRRIEHDRSQAPLLVVFRGTGRHTVPSSTHMQPRSSPRTPRSVSQSSSESGGIAPTTAHTIFPHFSPPFNILAQSTTQNLAPLCHPPASAIEYPELVTDPAGGLLFSSSPHVPYPDCFRLKD